MRKIKLYIAITIDGYIADVNGGIDWLTYFPNNGLDYGYDSFFETIDTVIMGGKTYRDILKMGINYPYETKQSYVVTRDNNLKSNDNIHFLTDNILQEMRLLRAETGKDIWVVGGSEIISLFLKDNLIDEMVIFYFPLMLGNGIRLFPTECPQSYWKLKDTKQYETGVMEVTYTK